VILFLFGIFANNPGLIFQPFWFSHSLVESIDKLYLPKIAVLRMNLAANFLSWKLPFLIFLEFFLLIIFLVGNMGTRVFGLLTIVKKIVKREMDDLNILLLLFLFFSLLFPLLFIQKGTAWNTIQFFYYFLFLANFYFALFLASLTESKSLKKKLFLAVLLLFTLPTTFSTARGYLGKTSPATIPYYELEGLRFLKKQPEGIVLTFPYDAFKKTGVEPPMPLYIYESTAYVSALTEKITFLEDEMNLEITNYPWRERKKETQLFFNSQDRIWARGFLLNNGIDYIYLVNDQQLSLSPENLALKMIFNNDQVRIYQVLK